MHDTETILGIIRREINDFTQNQIEVVPGCYFNQYDTIKRIHMVDNSKFENNVPYHGLERIFFNISTFRRDNTAKAIDIDTKDIRLVEDNPESEFATFIAEKEFKLFLKEDDFGQTLNDFSDDLATYGSIVAKKIGNKVENVDLRRLFLDPTVAKIQQSRFITHELFMTEEELREMDGKWDHIEDVIEKFGSYYAPRSYENDGTVNIQGSTSYYKIYERYGSVPEYMLNEKSKSKKLVRAMFVVAEPMATTTRYGNNGQQFTEEDGLVLAKVKWDKEYPFEDCHLRKIKGRWLGVGTIEELFPIQERFNEIKNQRRVSMETSAIHLFQTADRKAARNLAKYQSNGDVIFADQPITPVATEERNLAAFQEEEASYSQEADRLVYAFDQVRGEEISSSTPATNAVIQNNNVNSFFKKKRENFGLFISRLMNNHVLPSLLKNISKDHVLRFIGEPDDLAKLDSYIAPHYIKAKVIEEIMSGKKVYMEELQQITEEVNRELRKKGSQRFLDIKKDFYKNSKFVFDIVVTDEQRDTAVLAQNTFKIVSDLAANPALIEDPVMKAFYTKYASYVGISPMELELAIQKRQEMKANNPQAQGQMMPPQQLPETASPETTPVMNNPQLQNA
jgi:L-fucose mutarotase/ribose pyranase (RbsD/FucU family)